MHAPGRWSAALPGRTWSRRSDGCARRSAMRSKPPFFEQEGDNTCALACLRMILADRGMRVTEDELVGQTAVQLEGVAFEELARLARRYQLPASIERLDLHGAAGLL